MWIEKNLFTKFELQSMKLINYVWVYRLVYNKIVEIYQENNMFIYE